MNNSVIRDVFDRHGLSLSPKQEEGFELFLRAFKEYNSHTNLSAIRDDDGIVEKHFADSAMLAKFMDLSGKRLLDIGTGGGFPGIPLALLVDSLRVTLLDSVGKKIRACDEFLRILGLEERCQTSYGRAEDVIQTQGCEEAYDVVTSRATANMETILAWMYPFLKKDWVIVLYKTPSEDEFRSWMKQAKRLWLNLVDTFSYYLGDRERFLYVFRK